MENVLYLLSGLFLFFAFTTRSMLWLRILTGISAILGGVYAAFIGANIMLLGQIGLLGLNVLQIVLLMLEHKPLSLPPELDELYHKAFPAWTPREFLHFAQSAGRGLASNSVICRAGEQMDRLLCVLNGSAAIRKNGHDLDEIGPGAFIGEMGYLTGQHASADVVARGEVAYLFWTHPQLDKLRLKQPALYIKLLSSLGVDLIQKLQKMPGHAVADEA